MPGLDIYRKVPKDLTQPTVTGAVISVSSILFILFLLVSELSLFITVELVASYFLSAKVEKEVKGSFNPLESVDKTGADPIATHDYILRVVPTVYEDISGNIRYPFQYTYSQRGGSVVKP
nr:hypothetical protein BaRGS_025748 [Batillaria attramentaria]